MMIASSVESVATPSLEHWRVSACLTRGCCEVVGGRIVAVAIEVSDSVAEVFAERAARPAAQGGDAAVRAAAGAGEGRRRRCESGAAMAACSAPDTSSAPDHGDHQQVLRTVPCEFELEFGVSSPATSAPVASAASAEDSED